MPRAHARERKVVWTGKEVGGREEKNDTDPEYFKRMGQGGYGIGLLGKGKASQQSRRRKGSPRGWQLVNRDERRKKRPGTIIYGGERARKGRVPTHYMNTSRRGKKKRSALESWGRTSRAH